MTTAWLILFLSAVALVGGWLAWQPLRRLGREVHLVRTTELFRLQRQKLEDEFFHAAATSGKPRGLRWKTCDWDSTTEFVRERATGNLLALVGVTIAFDAVEGGDMEGIEAVGNLRNASAVFFFDRGHWHTVGKAIFNLNPDEAVRHFHTQYERVEQLNHANRATSR